MAASAEEGVRIATSWGGKPMSRRVAVLAASAALISGVATQAAAADPAACASLASLHLPDTTLTLAAPVTGGPLPPYCRVAGVIRPPADSQIGFETWLPLQNRSEEHTSELQ